MKSSLQIALSCALSTAFWTAASAAQATVDKSAGEACEKQVGETLRDLRGRDAQDVQFIGAKRVIAATQTTDETGVKGEGRYKGKSGAVSFTYSCAYNTATGETSGVMLTEKGRPAGDDKPWQPDLSNLSPEACERATAAALKDKYPRVARIVFGSDSRKLLPAPNAHTRLEGQGGLERAPGMNAVPFTYRCEFETPSGKLVSVQTSD